MSLKLKINKIGNKLFIMFTFVLLIVFGISYFMNNFLLDKYYIYKIKQNINSIYYKLKDMTLEEIQNKAYNIEQDNNITLIFSPYTNNIDELNENIKLKLTQNKITLNKFWITEETIKDLDNKEYINKIYNQGKLKSSIYVKIFIKENVVILMGTMLIHNSDIIKIINSFNLYLIIFSLIISLLIIWFFAKKMLLPLGKLKQHAKDISELKFIDIKLKTNDEIQELSESINIMSKKLQIAHEDLKYKNENLKLLISSISHEMKTPLSLINAYTIGLKDGLDDGTYFDVILEQIDSTSKMIDNLLNLSQIQRNKLKISKFDLKCLLDDIINRYTVALKNNNITIYIDLDDIYYYITADKSQIEIVLNNLISNALKYNHENYINIVLKSMKQKIMLSISNKNYNINEENIRQIWQPFYVVEMSRNKELSGTGLGLSIVADILDKHNLNYGVNLNNNEVNFYIDFVIDNV